MSLHPEHFGKYWWKVLHQAAAQATTPDKRKNFITLLTVIYPSLLPCASCREHFTQLLTKYNINDYSSSAEQLHLLTYLMHDNVNVRLGKTSIPYETAKNNDFPKEGSSMTCTTVCTETFESEHGGEIEEEYGSSSSLSNSGHKRPSYHQSSSSSSSTSVSQARSRSETSNEPPRRNTNTDRPRKPEIKTRFVKKNR